MAEFVGVGRVADFPLGHGRLVIVGGRHIALFRLDEGFFAVDNLCLHHAGPLCEGEVDGGVVTCPWHGWSYHIRSGTLVQDPRVGVVKHNARVIDGEVQVQLTD